MKESSDLIRSTVERLRPALGDMALPVAERLLEHVLTCSRSELYLMRAMPDVEQLREIDRIVKRCVSHEPLDYILGSAYFFNREFMVAPSVLLPRPDTEVLVEEVLSGERAEELLFADIGTGSGCIAGILTDERPGWRGIGIDRSFAALTIARRNCAQERVALVCSDMLSAVAPASRFDLIVSNPPYIPSETVQTLDTSVRDFEPHSALDGGPDGLDFYRKLAAGAPAFLKPGGRLYCEIGFDQEEAVRKLFSKNPWKEFRCRRDLAGHPRVIRCGLRKEYQ